MDDDNNFFSIPAPQDGPPPPPEGDAPIPLGEAPPSDGDFFGAPPADGEPTSYLGDVNEAGDAGGMNAFGDAGGMDAFAAPPADSGYEAPPDAFAAPPSDAFGAPDDGGYAPAPEEGAPIILGAPPPAVVESVDDEEPVPQEPPEPSPMAKWNEEWQETLKVRKDEENAKKAEFLEKARVDLENFQKEREMRRENKMAKNREDEQAKLEAIEADLENDNSWQKVVKMVELSHDSKQEAEDVKRMRDVFIYLKNDTSRAEVLGS